MTSEMGTPMQTSVSNDPNSGRECKLDFSQTKQTDRPTSK